MKDNDILDLMKDVYYINSMLSGCSDGKRQKILSTRTIMLICILNKIHVCIKTHKNFFCYLPECSR